MGKILVIGVGNSQQKVVEKLQQLMPESRCVLVGSYFYSKNPNIECFNLITNSKIAKEIFEAGCMPGTTHCMITKRLPEIVEEQRERLEEFLGLNTIRKD